MKTFFRLLRFLIPFRWQLLLAILLGCATIASNIGLLSMAAYLIAAAALGPLLIALTIPITVVRFTGVSRAFARYTERLVSHDATFRLLTGLRIWVYQRLEPLVPGRLLTYRSGDILARLVSDVDELQNIYLRVVAPLAIAFVMTASTFALFCIFSLRLALAALIFLLASGVGVPLLIGLLARHLGKREITLRATLNAHMLDSIQGVQDILACGDVREQQRKIEESNQALNQIQRRMALLSGLQQSLHDWLMNMALLSILLLAIPLVTSKAIGGVYLAFLTLLILASFEAVQPLGQAFQFLGHSLAAGERLFEIADAEPAVADPVAPLPVTGGQAHELAFEHVAFSYGPGEGEVVRDVSFQLKAGGRVALVGPSGSGKSTLMGLALRFWDPTRGAICLDGQDLRDYAQDDIHKLISVVSQDTYLFNNTLRGNLRIAREGVTDEAILRVLEQVRLDAFVASLPEGLETWIGEKGVRLSGGERQRLALARALLKDAPLLILDEPTAHLDPLTERELLDALDLVMQGRTTLMITHRLVSMERMNEILVLAEGRIQERGTHAQLLQARGLYQQLFDTQNSFVTLA